MSPSGPRLRSLRRPRVLATFDSDFPRIIAASFHAARKFLMPVFAIGDRLTTADTIDGTPTIHWRPRPDRFASRSASNRARPEHNTRPSDASHRIADVLTVDHGARRMTGDSDAEQTKRSTDCQTCERQ